MIDKKEKLVLRVNELYHDLAKDDYESTTNLKMFRQEKERWHKMGNFFKNKKSITILDIGTGAGFVPLTIYGFLKKSDMFICSDISKEMLNLLERKIKEEKFKCKFKFIKLNKDIPIKNNSIDIVTINSVLHHIPDTKYFLDEINKVLKKDGLVIIGHEPNIRFSRNKLLKYTNHILSSLLRPKDELKYISVKLGTYELIDRIARLFSLKRRKLIEKRTRLAAQINNELKKENLINRKLSIGEIMGLVDYKTGGFDPERLIEEYKLIHLETYNHLRGFDYSLLDNNRMLGKINLYMREKYPLDGRTFLAVYKK